MHANWHGRCCAQTKFGIILDHIERTFETISAEISVSKGRLSPFSIAQHPRLSFLTPRGRVLDDLDTNDLAKNTVVIYSSDQGFYLGEHGWYDKRWMFEESFRMPFVVRWPGHVQPGTRPAQLIQNIDYAPTFLEIAGLSPPNSVHGKSLVSLFQGGRQWRKSLYYAYYGIGAHGVPQHFGVRTERHKLIYFPMSNEWNLFDLKVDPNEMRSLHLEPGYEPKLLELKSELDRLRVNYAAPPYPSPKTKP
ncbi:MAG: DUF4976 domain-containing protein [Planctomycetaceae bacterium]|nr:DUF4976 domain-containing protein [Planctomycetaceae bacterium]